MSSMTLLNTGVGLESFLILAAVLFCIGLYGVLTKKSLIQIIMSIELLAIAMTINLVAINRWVDPIDSSGWFFALFEIALAAAELGLGFALAFALYRVAKSAEIDDFEELRG